MFRNLGIPAIIAVITFVSVAGCGTLGGYTGEWRSTQLLGGMQNEVDRMYLDLNADGTFNAQFEGPDAQEAVTGTYEISGKRLDLHHEEFEGWSFRFVDDELRASGGGAGVIVLKRPNGG